MRAGLIIGTALIVVGVSASTPSFAVSDTAKEISRSAARVSSSRPRRGRAIRGVTPSANASPGCRSRTVPAGKC